MAWWIFGSTAKLERERIEVCMNCKRLLKCENVGKLEDCKEFVEVEKEAWVIRKN